ncbi:beta strand repeat-containing protein [Rhodoferax antarcticus]|uniref:beta strand repeat-containing protein n=1 Tax=Rhodoferax antarcticus TaxID=81479 RepID=UPI00222424D3|nr:hypothetical protein [Rhodoferax antarcticus]MCW2314341.1 hypothetical protein [Rhodoferax antarcticus]
MDNLLGTSGNDTFLGDSAVTSAADTLTGGQGTDTFTLMMDAANEGVVASGVEIFNLQASGNARTFTASNVTGATGFISNASTDNLIVTGIAANAKLSAVKATSGTVNATDATVTGAGGFIATFASGAIGSTTGTLALATNGVGSAGTTYEFDVNSAGTDKFSTVEIASSTIASFIALDGSALALTTVKASGDALLTIRDTTVSNLGNVATVDASAMTAGGLSIDLATSSNAKDVKFTGGAGADTVIFAASQFTTLDVIDGGAGTSDAVVTGDAVFTASTDAVVKALNATTNVEVAGSIVTAADGIQVKMSVLTKQNAFTFGGVTPANNGAGVDGDVAATLTGIEDGDSFIITGNVVGGTSAAGDASGGDAINATPLVNSGSDTLSLTFKAGAAIAITGGASTDVGANGGKLSGDGLDAATIEKINITTASADDDVTFAAGAAAGNDTAGSSVKVGANAVITITGAGDVNLGTIVAPTTDADDLTVNGTDMTGVLTVTTGAGNDIIKGGSKADNITAGTGTNVITLGGGSDIFNVTKGAAVGAHDRIVDFTAGSSGDVLKGLSGSYDALTNAEQTAVSAELTLGAAVNTALVGATDSQWTAFTYGAKVYAVYDTNDAFDTTNAYIVELTGVTVANLTAVNFAA